MAALNLHHAIFPNEKASELALRSASSFLHAASERAESPTSHLFASAAYQDIIQRQPMHPDGPMSGWDLGLNLLGDPMTTAEHKSLEDYQTKMKLRRLHAINIAFELLFGIWGTYTTIRYFLAFADSSSPAEHVYALVLGITSALVVVLVAISISMPLVPQQSHLYAWRQARSLFRATYLVIVSAGTVMNLVLVLLWHPDQLCGWDIDISWYTSAVNTAMDPCHEARPAAWIAAAILRLVVTWVMTLSFMYALRAYHKTRHPSTEWSNPRYSPYLPSDPEDGLPSSPRRLFKSSLKLMRSTESDRTFSQSSVTFSKTNSISTLALSTTSCTGHSHSHSKDIPLTISPPVSRRGSAYGSSQQFRSETPSHTQPVNGVTEPSPTAHMLRRTSRISVSRVTSDTTLSDMFIHPERMSGRERSEMRSTVPWRAVCRSAGDNVKTTVAWESPSVRHTSRASSGSTSCSTAHEDEWVYGKDRDEDDMCAYGYGVSGSTYPYLDMYTPQRPGGQAESCEDVNGFRIGERWVSDPVIGPGYPDTTTDPSTRREEMEGETSDVSSGEEEEEYVAMMGGFVRRMATIESLGSREATGTLSSPTPTGSLARQSSGSKASTSPFSSVRFAEYGSNTGSTAYLSFSSGGTGKWVNERGEYMPGDTANGSGFSRTDEI